AGSHDGSPVRLVSEVAMAWVGGIEIHVLGETQVAEPPADRTATVLIDGARSVGGPARVDVTVNQDGSYRGC
ncbi:MAG: hypothetical protein QGI09_06085, partial [Dehalococcoidia bacterium]|nr:hypothetical protein [Dehalococcoidia bacterium]